MFTSLLIAPLLRKLALPALLAAAVWWGLHTLQGRAYDQGWSERDAQATAELRTAQELALKRRQENAADAMEREFAANQTAQDINQRAQKLETALRAALNRKDTVHEPRDASGHVAATLPDAAAAPSAVEALVLDRDLPVPVPVVGVLNAARATPRAGQPGHTDAELDAAGRAAADDQARFGPVTLTDLALNDLEVVRLYHQLAARHAGLVDWVNQQCLRPMPSK